MEGSAAGVQVLFICGAGRSGSTLFEGLLADALPDAVPVGEIRQVWVAGLRRDSICECGRPFLSCSYWSTVMGRLEATGGVDLDQTTSSLHRFVRVRHLWALLRDRLDDDERALGSTLEQLYRLTADEAHAAAIIDSSKAPQYGLFLAKATALDLHVVHLVRDSRAVAFSWSRTRAFSPGSSRSLRQRSTLQAAWRWNRHNALALLLRERAASYQRITYEDLARSPQAVVTRAIEGCTMRPSTGGTAPGARGHSFMGNPVRFDRPHAPRIVLDDEWRRAMRSRDRLLVTAATLPLLWWFGYRARA